MASFRMWLGTALCLTSLCDCSYKDVLRQFEVQPLADDGGKATYDFLRTDNRDGLDCIYPTDCKDIQTCGRQKSGIYRVFPFGVGEGFLVACDMASLEGGWLVIQRRQDGSVDFYRNWQNYTDGFGSLVGEFWLGLEKIHLLTSQRRYELLVQLGSYANGTRFARYGTFFVSSGSENFRLLVNTYSGDAGDSLKRHNGFNFSTFDNNNDILQRGHCAEYNHGAWWYQKCHDSNLNGKYYSALKATSADTYGVVWRHWLGHNTALQGTELKIRPI